MAGNNQTRQRLDSRRTRSELLKGALKEFAERGFDGASVRDIGARVGITHGSIRYHYETKEKLWLAAVDYLFGILIEKVYLTDEETEQLLAGDLDVFRNFLRKYVYYCAEHPEHARIMMREAGTPSNRLRGVAIKYLKATHPQGLKILEFLKDAGVLPENSNPQSLIYIITGACQNLFVLASEAKLALGYDALSPEAIEAHAETIVSLFCPNDLTISNRRK
ncbi:MAG: TetR/AcrR family transcriptional regulator [Pseudomonadota bacterium]